MKQFRAALIGICAACASASERELSAATRACHDEVKARIASPATANFQPTVEGKSYGKQTDGGYMIAGTFDAQNAMGAILRSSYVCDLESGATKFKAVGVLVSGEDLPLRWPLTPR